MEKLTLTLEDIELVKSNINALIFKAERMRLYRPDLVIYAPWFIKKCLAYAMQNENRYDEKMDLVYNGVRIVTGYAPNLVICAPDQLTFVYENKVWAIHPLDTYGFDAIVQLPLN